MKFLLILALFGINTAPTRSYDVTIVNCYDGDTCTFNVHLGMNVVLTNQTVRLCDINAPEIRPLETRAAAQKSRDALLSWITAAKTLQLVVPQAYNCDVGACDKTDKYGRWLGFVFADGANLNQRLLDQGLAVSYMYCSTAAAIQ